MAQVTDHAKNVHDVTVTDEIENQVRTAIRNEELKHIALAHFNIMKSGRVTGKHL